MFLHYQNSKHSGVHFGVNSGMRWGQDRGLDGIWSPS